MDDQTALREYLAEQDVTCPNCGYNLRGLSASKCPECGSAPDIHEIRPNTKVPWYDLFLPFWISLVMIFLGAGMFLWYNFPTQLLPNRRGLVLASVLASTLIPLVLLIGFRSWPALQKPGTKGRIHAWIYTSPASVFLGIWIMVYVLTLIQ